MNNDVPPFFRVGNVFLYSSGIVLIFAACASVLVYGRFINPIGFITYSAGIALLYLNYRIVDKKLKVNQ